MLPDIIAGVMIAIMLSHSACWLIWQMSLPGTHRRFVFASLLRITFPVDLFFWSSLLAYNVYDHNHVHAVIDLILIAIEGLRYRDYLRSDDDDWWSQTKKKLKKKLRTYVQNIRLAPAPA